jgi:hypothetical protein
MSKIITIKAVEGRLIMMPDRGFQVVPAEGVRVVQDSFYTRALNKGDVELVPDTAEVVATIEIDAAPVPPSTNSRNVRSGS